METRRSTGFYQESSPHFRGGVLNGASPDISAHLPHWQLNVLHQAASCFSRYDIRDIAIHVYLCNVLLIRLLKIRRQPTTGFALLMAHQVGVVQLGSRYHDKRSYRTLKTLISIGDTAIAGRLHDQQVLNGSAKENRVKTPKG
ncbi:hypothetical protein T265_13731, partial [Opisthorchis viverrini]